MGDAIVLAVLMAVICLIVRSMVKNHKKGGGCSGNCSSCSKGCTHPLRTLPHWAQVISTSCKRFSTSSSEVIFFLLKMAIMVSLRISFANLLSFSTGIGRRDTLWQ